MRKRAPERERGVQGGWCRERKAAGTDTGSMRADAKDGRAGGVPLINSLEFFINSFNFCRGKRGGGCAQPRSAGGVGSGKPRVAKGFGDGFPRQREAVESHVRTGRGCGKLCAGGQPGRLCGRAGALTGFQRGVDNNQQLAGTGDDSGHF